MADKEATVFVIDVGSSMGKCEQEREISNLEWSMQFVWDKITAKVYYPSMDWSLMEGTEREKDGCRWGRGIPHSW
jgi:ATP-dependent DNA helicase 2 subunit 2